MEIDGRPIVVIAFQKSHFTVGGAIEIQKLFESLVFRSQVYFGGDYPAGNVF